MQEQFKHYRLGYEMGSAVSSVGLDIVAEPTVVALLRTMSRRRWWDS